MERVDNNDRISRKCFCTLQLCNQCISDMLPFHDVTDNEFIDVIVFSKEPLHSEQFNALTDLSNSAHIVNSESDLNIANSCHTNEFIPDSIDNCEYYLEDEFINKIGSSNVNNCFSFIHFNSRSLSKNFDYINAYIDNLDFTFTIYGFSETWINVNTPILFNKTGYTFIHSDRQYGRGGGVGMLILNSINFKVRNYIMPQSNDFESIFIEIDNNKHKPVIVGVVYRKPKSNIKTFTDVLDESLLRLSSENKLTYIMGDFNIDHLKTIQNNVSDFTNMIFSHSFLPLIDQPTRVTENSASLIDNIYTNNICASITPGILYCDATDHFPIFQVTYRHRVIPMLDPITYRKIDNDTLNALKADLANANWINILQNDNVDNAYDIFSDTFKTIYDKNFKITVKKTHNKYKKPWLTMELVKLIRKKHKLYKKYCKDATEVNKKSYKNMRNIVNKLLRKARKDYYFDKFQVNKNNLKNTWNIIKKLIGNKNKTLPTYMIVNGDKVEDNKDIANSFNDLFVNLGNKLHMSIDINTFDFEQYMLHNVPDKSLFLKPINDSEVLNVVKSFKTTNSSGIDDLNGKVIKAIIHTILTPITYILNLSITTGIVPSKLKVAKVVPIHKKNDIHNIINYRPISILPFFSKILEKVVYTRINDYLCKNNIINPCQYGFQKNISTEMALIDLHDKIISSLNKKLHTIGIFIDLSKAFDSIDHDILIKKLSMYGVRGIPLLWFKNYLSGRLQYVSFNKTLSDPLPIHCGIPQGSILGPLLYIIYVNDFCYCSNAFKYILFADDTTLLISHENIVHLSYLISSELDNVSKWFDNNRLVINVEKSNYMYFHNKRKAIPIELNDNFPVKLKNYVLKRLEVVQFLGCSIDQYVTWVNHIQSVSSKISKSIGILSKLRHILPKRIMILLYNTLILPHLTYCNSVWGNTYKSRLQGIYKLQKRVVRLCTHAEFRAPSKPIFISLNVLNIYQLNKYCTMILLFKYNKQILPPALNDMFSLNSSIHSYNTRNSSKFHVGKVNKEFMLQSIRHSGPSFWNSLPSSILVSPSPNVLKKRLKLHLLSYDFAC